MNIQRYESSKRMSQAVVHGNTVYLSGQVGHGEGVAQQTRDALSKVERLLQISGGSKSRILSVTIWLADMDDFDAMNEVYDAWVDPENLPTRACGESWLAAPEYLVEIIVVAAKS
jgi:enamine deaminase RidA (YjgF/YER057c/UK114 family)